MDGVLIGEEQLRRFTTQVFRQSGMREPDAAVLADHLVWADCRGISWLGVQKIPQYLARIRMGGTKAAAESTVVADHAAFLVVDAHDTFGQIACYHTMRTVIDRARLSGVALALVRNTTSAGALGYFAMQAANEKMIGLAINNSPPLQPAWGGKEKLVGNQAFAVASPADRHKPLLLDMATSAITLARIHEYQAKGLMLPEGVALDAAGEPTVDPATALAGMLLPMGGHRGYGLALMWEVLTGVLAGSDRYASNVTMPGVAEQAQGVSVFLLAIDPTFSMPYDAFVSRVDSLIDAIHATPPAVDNSPVVVPGERSHEAERRHHLEGIWLSAELVATLEEIGTEAGISFASFV